MRFARLAGGCALVYFLSSGERSAKNAAAQIARGGTMRSSTTALLAALLLAGASGAAHAQTYPSATVKLIVPVPAGGVTDTMARIVAQRLTEAWGQPVVVDNRPGGNYAVGAQAVAKSPADGLTLLVAPDSTVTANPHLFSKLPYDPVKDLTPIIVLCRITPVLVINPTLAVQTVQELIALAAAGEKRAALRPDLPTISEAGVPGFSTTAWFALFGPANMAPDLVAKIHADVAKVLELPQSREFFRVNSFERVDLTPAQFSKLIQDDLAHWGALIKAVGAKLD